MPGDPIGRHPHPQWETRLGIFVMQFFVDSLLSRPPKFTQLSRPPLLILAALRGGPPKFHHLCCPPALVHGSCAVLSDARGPAVESSLGSMWNVSP